eukprot:3540925-Prymnesium_polylepis.1
MLIKTCLYSAQDRGCNTTKRAGWTRWLAVGWRPYTLHMPTRELTLAAGLSALTRQQRHQARAACVALRHQICPG